jgi:acyl carrier protein
MRREEFFEGMANFLAQRAGVDAAEITPDMHLIKSGIVDSVLLTELILYTEDVTDKCIDIDHFRLDFFTSMEAIYSNYCVGS